MTEFEASGLAERLAERAAQVPATVAYNHLVADLSRLVFESWGR